MAIEIQTRHVVVAEAPGPTPPAMVWIPSATDVMGSNDHYPEEGPVHRVSVDGFWIDEYPVTNERFTCFVEAAGHVTLADLPPDPALSPGSRCMVRPERDVEVEPRA